MPMLDVMDANYFAPRILATLLASLGLLALLLAAVGIYGVISYSVSQRTQEIGIRMALGAARKQILIFILGKGIRPVLLGIGIGLSASLASTRLMASLLFGIRPTDPLTYIFMIGPQMKRAYRKECL